jgi:hypothetical protein
MSEQEDPRARFRQLPEPVRLEDVVETSPAEDPQVVETPAEVYLRVIAGSAGAG